MPTITLLIVDIDNTLFDWFYFWYHSFSAMVDAVLRHTNVDRDLLLKQIQEVHRRHKTTEYAWLLEEVPSVATLSQTLRDEVIQAGKHAYRDARARTETLYPDVASTLHFVKQCGARLVGFTESQRFYTIQRLIRFGLDGVLDALYCTQEHPTPPEIDLRKERSKPDDAYSLKLTRVVELGTGVRKPNPRVLTSIVSDFHATPKQVLYVGDSKMKDIYMAQHAGVYDAYAQYGDAMSRNGYDLLRAVSSWSSEEIHKEKVMAVEISPNVILRHSFGEILDYFVFTKPTN